MQRLGAGGGEHTVIVSQSLVAMMALELLVALSLGLATATTLRGRSGLGLTIVRQTAEAHGGEVKLVSEPGHGAAFALWLPALADPLPGPSPAAPDHTA